MTDTFSPRPKLIYVPEDTQPTIATEGNRCAIAYLELQNDGTEHYYGMLFTASEDMLAALELCEDALSDLARLDDGTPSVSALLAARGAIAKARRQRPLP